MHLNAQRYYRDVALLPARVKPDQTVVEPKIVAIAGNIDYGSRPGSPNIRSLEVFRVDLAGEPTGMTSLTIMPNHLAVASNLPVWDYDRHETVYHDIALVTSTTGGIAIYDIPEDGTDPVAAPAVITTPAGTTTKHLAIDSNAMLAYVGASGISEETGSDGLLVVDLSDPLVYRGDVDGDGWNDRIIGRIPLRLPGFPGQLFIHSLRVDPERGLVYAGIAGTGNDGLAIIKVHGCSDLKVDFKAVAEPEPPYQGAEKAALQQVINNGMTESGVQPGVIDIIAYGDRSCLWKSGRCSATGQMQHRYRFAVLIPESEWANRHTLIEKLHDQVLDSNGNPKPVSSQGYEITFADITFIPIKWEEFASANLSLAAIDDNFGLAPQATLLEILLKGTYVWDIPGLGEDPVPLWELLDRLTERCNECPTIEPSHIWRQEGYELAKLQEAAFYQSGALIRFIGEAEPGTTLYEAWQADLREIAEAGLRATLGRLLTNEEANSLLALAALQYGIISTTCTTPDETDSISDWKTITCGSFNHWIASMAAYTVEANLGIFSLDDLRNKIFTLQQVADGIKTIATEEEGVAFIAMVRQFIASITDGPAWAIYQAKLMDDPARPERQNLMATLEASIFNLQQQGIKKIVPRYVNKGPINAKDIWVRMYEPTDTGNLFERKAILVDLETGTEKHLNTNDFILENIQQAPPGTAGWISFTVDLPERTVPEPNRDNNRSSLYYYVLDPANPTVPMPPPEPPLPLPDPDNNLFTCDTACDCNKPSIAVELKPSDMSFAGDIQLLPEECINFDLVVTNLSNQIIENIQLASTLFDGIQAIDALAPQGEATILFQYCAPNEQLNLTGEATAAFVFQDRETIVEQSNTLTIVITSQLAVDGKANGADEFLTAPGETIFFSANLENAGSPNITYFWDFGDGISSTEAAPQHNYSQPGNYPAKIIVTADGIKKEDTITISIVEVNVFVNQTADDLDDLVRLKSTVPDKSFPIPTTIALTNPCSRDVNVVLENANGRLGFDTVDQQTLPLTLPRDGSPVHFTVIGLSKSDLVDDALITVHLNDLQGPVIGEEDLTVFWFDAEIEVTPGGFYILHKEEGYIPVDFVLNENGDPILDENGDPILEDSAAVSILATATVMPENMDPSCTETPQIKHLRIGIVQNVEKQHIESEYANPVAVFDTSAPADAEMTVPTGGSNNESLKTVPPAFSSYLDSFAAVSPLYITAPAGELPADYNYLDRLGKLASSGSFISGSYDDTDSPRIKNSHADFAGIGKVTYTYSSVRRETDFRVWAVTVEMDDSNRTIKEVVPIRETTWSINLNSNETETFQRATVPGENAQSEPTREPILNAPYINDITMHAIANYEDFLTEVKTFNQTTVTYTNTK
ncbi:MAG: hypothetical protein BZ151_11760 [Desulfobacca sp. 4484_104]|nr:MAG: hypothetical protein BZ151_11760 [Desulfobacca sp. 4484_104]